MMNDTRKVLQTGLLVACRSEGARPNRSNIRTAMNTPGGMAPANAPRKAAKANDNPETFQYYYHSDHLGSTSLITNLDGEVVQHVEYLPFGEVFLEERNNRWNTPFLFNAKELDGETGLYYYGARYYDPRTSVWLSTDPLQEKYPNISTYAYCLNNPVRYIDPKGKDVWDFLLGVLHSVGSSLSLGTANTSTNGMVSNAGDYNAGRDVGDVVSIGMGIAETIVGGGAALGGGAATVASAGTASPVSVPVVVAGAGMVAHGIAATAKAATNLMSQEGRISQAEATRGNEKSNTSSGNKNSPQANQKAKESAGQKYNDTKAKYEDLKSKPNKTKEESKQVENMKRQVEHLKRKADETGETHSRNAKGNR